MAEIIRLESDGSLSFGDYTLTAKTKKEDFPANGDLYKVKTFAELTKLEKNGAFAYESVPGTTVTAFKETADGVSFEVSGAGDAQLTVGLAEDTEYSVSVDGVSAGKMKTNMGGKLVVSVEIEAGKSTKVDIIK